MRLDRTDRLPEALDRISPRELRALFPNPTLVEIPGVRPEPLFVSTFLHGNETTSLDVLRHLARRTQTTPPRSLMIFVGNVEAAERGVRRLEDGPDFNRIWADGPGAAHALAREVFEAARARRPFASIDVHNNTGKNPVYGCVSALRPADLFLAAAFSPVGVYYTNPPTTQSVVFSRLCPSVTLECGVSGDPDGVAAAINLIDRALDLDAFPEAPPPPDAVRLHHTIGRVLVEPDCSVSFGEPGADLVLREDLEDLNFTPLPAGAFWARTRPGAPPLKVVDERGGDLTAEFFSF